MKIISFFLWFDMSHRIMILRSGLSFLLINHFHYHHFENFVAAFTSFFFQSLHLCYSLKSLPSPVQLLLSLTLDQPYIIAVSITRLSLHIGMLFSISLLFFLFTSEGIYFTDLNFISVFDIFFHSQNNMPGTITRIYSFLCLFSQFIFLFY